MKTTLYYGVANGKNPGTLEPVKRPYLTNRQVYDISGVVDYAINAGHIRGKKYDLVGILNGCISSIRELILMGYVVDLDSWLLFYLMLTGQVGNDLKLTDANQLRFRVRALKDLQVSTSDFTFVRIDDTGLKIEVESVASPNGVTNEVVYNSVIVATGKNLRFAAANGDTAKVSWVDASSGTPETREVALTPVEVSATYLRFNWPATLTAYTGTLLSFEFCLHEKEGAADQTSSVIAKLVGHDPEAPTVTISKLYSVGAEEPAEQGTLSPNANIYVKGANLTKVDGDTVTVVITEAGTPGTEHTHTLEILESDATHMTLKMPTEVASYNMPTLGDFTFQLHGGVEGSAVQTITKNDISIAF